MFTKKSLMFCVIMLTLLVSTVAAPLTAFADGPESMDIRVWTNSPVVAGGGLQIEAQVSTPSGVVVARMVRVMGEGITEWTGGLNDTGGVVAIVAITTTAGPYSGKFEVGHAGVFCDSHSRTIQVGDCWWKYAEEHYPGSLASQKAFVDTHEDEALVAGQVITYTLTPWMVAFQYEVVPAEADQVEWTSALQAIAGEKPVVSGEIQDQFGNPVTESMPLTVTLGTETFVVQAAPDFTVQASQVYTQAGQIALGAEPYFPVDPAGFEIVPAEPTKLTVDSTVPTELEAGGKVDIPVYLMDSFGNRIDGKIVSMEAVTATTGTAGPGWVLFSYNVPTQTQKIELTFGAAGLSTTHEVTVTPTALETVTATVRENGSILVLGFDKYENVRAGDAVTVTVEADGVTTTIQAKTMAPPEVEPAAAAMAAVPSVAGETHEVVIGESLWSIWEAEGRPGEWTEWRDATAELSGLTNPSLIQVGQVLALPATS